MFSFIFSLVIFLLLFKFLVNLGFGVTKLILSIIAIVFAFILIPVSIALIIPALLFIGFIFAITSISRAL